MGDVVQMVPREQACRSCLYWDPSNPDVCTGPEPPHLVCTWAYGYMTCGYRPDPDKLIYLSRGD